MRDIDLYRRILGLPEPWEIIEIELDRSADKMWFVHVSSVRFVVLCRMDGCTADDTLVGFESHMVILKVDCPKNTHHHI